MFILGVFMNYKIQYIGRLLQVYRYTLNNTMVKIVGGIAVSKYNSLATLIFNIANHKPHFRKKKKKITSLNYCINVLKLNCYKYIISTVK